MGLFVFAATAYHLGTCSNPEIVNAAVFCAILYVLAKEGES
jgi:hypothetical protein